MNLACDRRRGLGPPRAVPCARVITLATVVLLARASSGQQRTRATPLAPAWIDVPAATFVMGSDTEGEADEHPRHRVAVGAFRIDRDEVSRERYARCVLARVCTAPRALGPRFEDPRQPVVGVSWDQARAYCAWVGGRLPTEQEWERAARGTDGRRFPWGNTFPTDELATFGRPSETGQPDPVGRHPRGASPVGALDMGGNVWEWTASPYDPLAYEHPDVPASCETALASLAEIRARGLQGFTGSNPLPTGCERVLRGGGWNYGGAGLRASNRVHHPPGFRISVAGFRCAADAR